MGSRDRQASPFPIVSPNVEPLLSPAPTAPATRAAASDAMDSTNLDPVPSLTALGPHVPQTAQKAYLVFLFVCFKLISLEYS